MKVLAVLIKSFPGRYLRSFLRDESVRSFGARLIVAVFGPREPKTDNDSIRKGDKGGRETNGEDAEGAGVK